MMEMLLNMLTGPASSGVLLKAADTQIRVDKWLVF